MTSKLTLLTSESNNFEHLNQFPTKKNLFPTSLHSDSRRRPQRGERAEERARPRVLVLRLRLEPVLLLVLLLGRRRSADAGGDGEGKEGGEEEVGEKQTTLDTGSRKTYSQLVVLLVG